MRARRRRCGERRIAPARSVTRRRATATTPTRKSPDNATQSGAVERRGGVTSSFMADVGQRVLISGMGGETRLARRQSARKRAVGGIARGNRRRSTPPAAPPRRLPPHRARRPRPHRRRGDQVRSARPGAPRGLGAALPGQPRSGPAAHRRRRHVDPRRGGRVPVARVDRRAQRHRDLRAGAAARSHGPTKRRGSIPTSGFGKMLAGIELTATTIGTRIGVAVGALRFAPVIGPHVPSPLGRYLRMPAVPFSALADPPFAVVQEIDVAAAFVAARADPARRAGQHRRSRRDHRVPRDPPRPSRAGADDRTRMGDRPRLVLPRRSTDPRPRARADAPWAARRRRPCVGGARSRAHQHHARGHRQALQLAERGPHAGPRGGWRDGPSGRRHQPAGSSGREHARAVEPAARTTTWSTRRVTWSTTGAAIPTSSPGSGRCRVCAGTSRSTDTTDSRSGQAR